MGKAKEALKDARAALREIYELIEDYRREGDDDEETVEILIENISGVLDGVNIALSKHIDVEVLLTNTTLGGRTYTAQEMVNDFPGAFLTDSDSVDSAYGEGKRYKVKTAFRDVCKEMAANWKLMATKVYEGKAAEANVEFYNKLKARWWEQLPGRFYSPSMIKEDFPGAFLIDRPLITEEITPSVREGVVSVPRYRVDDRFVELCEELRVDWRQLSHHLYAGLNTYGFLVQHNKLKARWAELQGVPRPVSVPQERADAHHPDQVFRDFPGAFLIDEPTVFIGESSGFRYQVHLRFRGLCDELGIDWKIMSSLVYKGLYFHCDAAKYEELRRKWSAIQSGERVPAAPVTSPATQRMPFAMMDRDIGDAMLKSQTVGYGEGRRYKVKTAFRDICQDLDIDWQKLSNCLHEGSDYSFVPGIYSELVERWVRYKGNR